MALTLSDRFTLKRAIAQRLSPESWNEIDLVLREFGANTLEDWDDGENAYVLQMLKDISDTNLSQLAAYLNIVTAENGEIDPPSFWKDGQLRVFLSHLAEHKKKALRLKEILANYGICAFVAHEDIEPTREWELDIEKALRTCDALVPILHDGFNESKWTDQEIGFARCRDVTIDSIAIDMAPYGLIGRKQAISGKGREIKEVAHDLVMALIKDSKTASKMSDCIVRKFCDSNSFAEARVAGFTFQVQHRGYRGTPRRVF